MILLISQGSIESKESEPEDTFPGPRYRNNIRSGVGRKVKVKCNARFPRIHKKEPVDFHSLNILLRKIHSAVPS